MNQLKDEFYSKTGIELSENDTDIRYVDWLESKVKKLYQVVGIFPPTYKIKLCSMKAVDNCDCNNRLAILVDTEDNKIGGLSICQKLGYLCNYQVPHIIVKERR